MTVLNEKEYRIFLSAMSREEKVCKILDDTDSYQNKGIKLVPICKSIKTKIKNAVPSKYAYWIHETNNDKDYYVCSNCLYGSNEEMPYDKGATKFCPNCGSQMSERRN